MFPRVPTGDWELVLRGRSGALLGSITLEQLGLLWALTSPAVVFGVGSHLTTRNSECRIRTSVICVFLAKRQGWQLTVLLQRGVKIQVFSHALLLSICLSLSLSLVHQDH